jgi:hypothetical protein
MEVARYRRVTFNTAPDNLSEIYVINPGRSTQLNTVSDNAITAAKLQTDAVTTAKIQDDAVTSAKIADGTIVSSNIAPGTIANDRLANTGITINGTSIALGASGEIVAGTDWQAVVVADGSTQLNAAAGKGYFLDTNAGVIDVKLPSSPTRGDTIVLADYGNNFATNRVVVDTGGKLIDSVVGGEPGSGGFTIETNGAVVELVFADDTAGWIIKQNNVPADLGAESYAEYISATGGTVATSGDYKIHTFTGDGCFVVSSVGNPIGSISVDYLVVAGGAGAGSTSGANSPAGGGAGGFRESHTVPISGCYTASPLASCTSLPVTSTTYPITVGGGGAAGPCGPGASGTGTGNAGSNSIFSTITSAGGGAPQGAQLPGNAGGSGAGGGGGTSVTATGGAGNTPPVSPPQGQPGGTGSNTTPDHQSGGGGGAGGAGTNSSPSAAGTGGVGVSTSISGSSVFYAGGGGGTGYSPVVGAGLQGNGSPCGTGGQGVAASPFTADSGTANRGGGGGSASGSTPSGANPATGGAGGKGIVIIRYKFQN